MPSPSFTACTAAQHRETAADLAARVASAPSLCLIGRLPSPLRLAVESRAEPQRAGTSGGSRLGNVPCIAQVTRDRGLNDGGPMLKQPWPSEPCHWHGCTVNLRAPFTSKEQERCTLAMICRNNHSLSHSRADLRSLSSPVTNNKPQSSPSSGSGWISRSRRAGPRSGESIKKQAAYQQDWKDSASTRPPLSIPRDDPPLPAAYRHRLCHQ